MSPVVKRSIKNIFQHTYDVFIPRKDFPLHGSYILSQWHGTADATIIKDSFNCIAKIPDENLVELCTDGSCRQGDDLSIFFINLFYLFSGVILDELGEPIGLNYEQGGYPPLTFHFKEGYFYVIARSDEHTFIKKSGCHPRDFGDEDFKCPDHPRQQVSFLTSFYLVQIFFHLYSIMFYGNCLMKTFLLIDGLNSLGKLSGVNMGT